MSKEKVKKTKGEISLALLILIILVVVMVVVLLVNNKKGSEPSNDNTQTTQEEGGSKTNVSEELKKEKTFFGYKISDVVLKETEGESTFTATLTNTTENTIGNESIYLVFRTKAGEEMYKMEVYLPAIEPEKSIDINSTITIDVVEAYDLEIVKE